MANRETKYQVKARLLPLSTVERFLEKLIEALPRRNVCASITPVADVAVLSQAKGEYKATGEAPRFALNFEVAIQPGWYYLEAALVRNNGSPDAAIEVIARERSIIAIPTNLRGSVREVFCLPEGVTQLYWAPTGAPGFFSQTPLLIHKISAIESFFRRAHRVAFDLWRFKNMWPAARAGLTWLGLLTNLGDAYERTAKLRLQRLAGNDYAAFIERNDTLKKADIRNIRQQISKLPSRPVFSLLMPLRTADPHLLSVSLSTLVGQLYPHWELLIISTLPEGNAAREVAYSYSMQDRPIKIVKPENADGHGVDIAILLNTGLKASAGEYVARINPHDRLPTHALYLLAKELNGHPEADFIYSDDDNIDSENTRQAPRFKPDWNPDLLRSHNYIDSLGVFRRSRVLQIGGYNTGYGGAEDYELILRYLKDMPETGIRHIPRALYHRHTISAEAENSNASHEAGRRALQQHFHGTGVRVEDGPSPNLYRIKHPLPVQPPLASIIIPTRDEVDILRSCIESIQQKTDYSNWELLIVDNQSTKPETLAYLENIRCDKRKRVIQYDKPFNYSAINNYAVQHAKGEIIALLNNDVEVISTNWLAEMVSHAIRPGVGAVGAKLLYSNGRVQHAGVITGIGGVAGHAHKYIDDNSHGYCHRAVVTQNLSAVTGACLVVKKQVYQQIGGMNQTYLSVAFNDIDFCLKLIAAGYRNVFTPYAQLYHHESISRGRDDTLEKHAIFVQEFEYMKKTWGERLQRDPAYNPNLTLEFENFSLSR